MSGPPAIAETAAEVLNCGRRDRSVGVGDAEQTLGPARRQRREGRAERGDPEGMDRRDTRLPIEAALLTALFDHAAVGIYATDAEGRLTACNPHTERLLGYPEGDIVGVDVHALIHRAPGGTAPPAGECLLREVMAAARPADGRGLFARVDGTLLPVRWAAAPTMLAASVTGSVVVFIDETTEEAESDRRAAEHTALAAAHDRLSLLADATTALSSTLEVGEALHRLARITVPRLADWSVVDLLTEDGEVERVAVAHRDPGRPVPSGGLLGPMPATAAECGPGTLAGVLAGGEPILLTDLEPPRNANNPVQRSQLDLFDQLDACCAIIAPLRARGRVLGALTVARTDPTRAYGHADIALVADLAGRAGLATDNARLYSAQRATAEALQRSLLPQLPSTRHLSLAARYRPARAAAEVGGDWYDAFRTLDGRPALVIGDVVGHGLAATARMGELRNLLRGIAVTTGAPPSEVITRFDQAVTHLNDTDLKATDLTATDLTATDLASAELATAIYARVEGVPGGPRRLVWCNAGHPPPLLIGPDGNARYLEDPSGLLLGLDDRDRADGQVDLPAGSTLLLYTDGLVETREQPLSDGLSRLRHHAATLTRSMVDQPLDGLCDQLLDRLTPAGNDDVALLAARIEH
jgi:PAS domain S-box-containing protein